MMKKNFLMCSILLVAVIHTILLAYNYISRSAALWGLLMQLMYYQFLNDFPYVNLKSSLCLSTLGKLASLLSERKKLVKFFFSSIQKLMLWVFSQLAQWCTNLYGSVPRKRTNCCFSSCVFGWYHSYWLFFVIQLIQQCIRKCGRNQIGLLFITYTQTPGLHWRACSLHFPRVQVNPFASCYRCHRNKIWSESSEWSYVGCVSQGRSYARLVQVQL